MELIHKDKTEVIIGIMFDVYNELGSGYREKYYERAVINEAKRRSILVKSQTAVPVKYKDEVIGNSRVDLIFYDLILVELKIGKALVGHDFKQINEYLQLLKLPLGLIVLFSPEGVKFRRIANFQMIQSHPL